jgi:sulfur carrier protein
MIKITVNGKNEDVEKTSVTDYLKNKNININTVVVEINGLIIQKNNLSNTMLNENDKIEIIRFIGGG